MDEFYNKFSFYIMNFICFCIFLVWRIIKYTFIGLMLVIGHLIFIPIMTPFAIFGWMTYKLFNYDYEEITGCVDCTMSKYKKQEKKGE